MRPDLDAIRARCEAANPHGDVTALRISVLLSAADVPVLLDYIRELEAALPRLPWGENDECYSCGSGEGDPHFDGCAWNAVRLVRRGR